MMDHRREWRSGVDCNWRSREDLIWRVLAQSPVRTQKASLSLSIFSGFFVKWCATSYVVDTFSSSHLCYATSPFRAGWPVKQSQSPAAPQEGSSFHDSRNEKSLGNEKSHPSSSLLSTRTRQWCRPEGSPARSVHAELSECPSLRTPACPAPHSSPLRKWRTARSAAHTNIDSRHTIDGGSS